MNQKEKHRILKLYNQISFPASFGSARKFRRSLRDHANIEISEKALNSILQEDLAHKMSRVKPKNPNQRSIVANSVGVSAQVQIITLVSSLDFKHLCNLCRLILHSSNYASLGH